MVYSNEQKFKFTVKECLEKGPHGFIGEREQTVFGFHPEKSFVRYCGHCGQEQVGRIQWNDIPKGE
ncbi:hypothetical protein LCGC14_1282510 [marine sediment metagenome]|uniref:Uncharacterized protein n=1 Tax=marine sediment metagenome TaxID=412755 RepID=A0A0F9NBD4_9ZZZZ